jgi:hypothetical protein
MTKAEFRFYFGVFLACIHVFNMMNIGVTELLAGLRGMVVGANLALAIVILVREKKG